MLLQYWYLVEVSTEKQCANECYSSAKQSAPSPHLTKTLLVVSAAAVFSWLPHAIILNMTAAHMVSVPIIIFHCFYILTYSSSFVNPIIYALRIPEFRQSLVTLCSRRRAVDRMDRKGKDEQDTGTIDLIEQRTLPMILVTQSGTLNTSLRALNCDQPKLQKGPSFPHPQLDPRNRE